MALSSLRARPIDRPLEDLVEELQVPPNRYEQAAHGTGILALRSEPGLEQFLGGLLAVEAEYLIGEDGRIAHADVPLRRAGQFPRLLKVAHRAPCLRATRARAHD